MTLKLFRAAWFLSVLLVLVNLLFVYAGLPENVIVQDTDDFVVHREWFFYSVMLVIVGINLMVYLIKMVYYDGENLRSWFHGLIVTVNIFIMVSLQALGVFNSHEAFDHNRLSFYLGGSLTLTLLWAAFWPLYLIFQKFFIKQAV